MVVGEEGDKICRKRKKSSYPPKVALKVRDTIRKMCVVLALTPLQLDWD
jgi:hypothetical protein